MRVLFAGLNVVVPGDLALNIRVEQIFENNLVAQIAQTAKKVLLGLKSDLDAPMRPVCGLRYEVQGRSLIGADDYDLTAHARDNARIISALKLARFRGELLISHQAA